MIVPLLISIVFTSLWIVALCHSAHKPMPRPRFARLNPRIISPA